MHGTGLSDHALTAISRARRATSLARTMSAGLTVEVRPLASLQSMIEPWKALAARALEPNIFYEPEFALAAAPVFGIDVQAGLVWPKDSPRELFGLFPVQIQTRRYGLPLPVLCSWTHPFAPFGTPLVHRDLFEPVVAAWLDYLATEAAMPSLMLMPYLNEDGAFVPVLDSALASRGCPSDSFDRHQRALLAPNSERADYLHRTINAKRRKELGRQMRRLEECGRVSFARATGSDVSAALEDFLRIEASGWKGRAHSAAANREDVRRFVTRAVAGLAAHGVVTIDRLLVEREPIAAIITLRSGPSAWCWKIAYDEAYARFSPGTQLLVRVTEELLSDSTIVRADSLATPNHPLIDHVWAERMTISDRLISLKSDSLVPFALASRLEAIRRLGVGAARAMREHLRG